MDGFEHATYEKLQGIHPQLIIRPPYGQELNNQKIEEVIAQEFPEVAALSPSASQYLIIQPPDEDTTISLLILRGIEPEKEACVSTLSKTIIASTGTDRSLEFLKQPDAILIGEQCAHTQHVTVGDTLELMIPESSGKKNIHFSPYTVRIAGIFKTGIDDFDAHVLFCSLHLLQQLFPDSGISSIGMSLHDKNSEPLLLSKLQDRLHLQVFSWRDLYPALLSALTLEKYVMFFVLALITLVASMSIISLLFMLITQKRADIALYKSLGVPDATIRSIFIIIGMGLAIVAGSLGLFAAIAIGFSLDRYQLIKLPDIYYVSHLPAHIHLSTCLLVFLVVLLLSLFACWLATRSISRMNISQILRYEG